MRKRRNVRFGVVLVALMSCWSLLASPLSAHPYGTNHGVALRETSTGVNGIQANIVVPTDVMDFISTCQGGAQAYLVAPNTSACLDTNNIIGGNARPMQIGSFSSNEFVATGIAVGCADGGNGRACAGFASNRQMHKRRYVDGRNDNFYYVTMYEVVNPGTSQTLRIQRTYVNGSPVWLHYLNNGSVVTTNQGSTLTVGYGSYGSESARGNVLAVLNIDQYDWNSMSVRSPNGPYYVPGFTMTAPHTPACIGAYYPAVNSFQVEGRC